MTSNQDKTITSSGGLGISAKDKIALIIATVCMPSLCLLYLVFFIFKNTFLQFIYSGQLFLFLIPVVVFSLLIPFLGISILKKIKMIDDVFLESKTDLFLPTAIRATSYFCLAMYFYSAKTPFWFIAIFYALIVVVILSTLIKYFWNISYQLMIMGFLTGVVLALSLYYSRYGNYLSASIIAFILSGLVGSSRMILKPHTFAELGVAYIIGIFIAVLSVCGGFYLTYFPN